MTTPIRPRLRTSAFVLLTLVALGAAATVPVACGSVVVTPIDNARNQQVRPGATEGPWARCRFDTASPHPGDGPSVCPDPDATHEGPWTCVPDTEDRTWGNGYTYCKAYAVCNYACSTAADCPAPSSGTASLECMAGTCQLACEHDAACPDGMRCTFGRCMWIYADYCDNGPLSPAAPCAGKETCAHCSICDGCDSDAFCNPDGDCELGDPTTCGAQ